MIAHRLIVLIITNISDKICTENQNTHLMFSNFFFSENPAFYEMWKKYDTTEETTDDNIIRRRKFDLHAR